MSMDIESILSEARVTKLSADTIAKRKKAYQTFVNKQSEGIFFSLIEHLFSLPVDEEPIRKFIATLTALDEQFTPKPNSFETRVNIAAAIASAVEEDSASRFNTRLILGVLNCFGFGLRPTLPRINLVRLIETFLDKNYYLSNPKNLLARPSKDFNEIQKLIPEAANPEKMPAVLQRIGTKLRDIETYSIISMLKQQEETEFLWSMLSGSSKYLNTFWSKMKAPQVCLILGYELASFVKVDLGPQAIRIPIRKALESCTGKVIKTTNLLDVLNATPKSFLQHISQNFGDAVSNLTPVHLCIQNYLSSKSTTKFMQSISSHKIDVSKNILLESFSLQMYRECVFLSRQ